MTIEEMLVIQPRLKYVVKFVKDSNYMAKHRTTYWHNVWSHAKKLSSTYIGIGSENGKLNEPKHYDLFHNYLKSLATNCK